MTIAIVTLSVVIVIGLILILLVATYNHFQDYIIRINEADENIDSVLRKRFDLLNKSIGIIKANIDKDRHVNGKMCIVRSGKEAISKYKVIKEFKEYSLVEFSLLTGRTHQIRVHASYINHPLLGDVLYGGNMLYSSRVALHSYSISFNHPINKKPIDICISLPIDLDILTK